jgi:hypothetical protein
VAAPREASGAISGLVGDPSRAWQLDVYVWAGRCSYQNSRSTPRGSVAISHGLPKSMVSPSSSSQTGQPTSGLMSRSHKRRRASGREPVPKVVTVVPSPTSCCASDVERVPNTHEPQPAPHAAEAVELRRCVVVVEKAVLVHLRPSMFRAATAAGDDAESSRRGDYEIRNWSLHARPPRLPPGEAMAI